MNGIGSRGKEKNTVRIKKKRNRGDEEMEKKRGTRVEFFFHLNSMILQNLAKTPRTGEQEKVKDFQATDSRDFQIPIPVNILKNPALVAV